MLKILHKSFPINQSYAKIEILPISVDTLTQLYQQDLSILSEFLHTPAKALLYPFFHDENFSFEDAEKAVLALQQSLHLKYQYYLSTTNSLLPTHSLSHFSDNDQNLYVLGLISNEQLQSYDGLLHKMSNINSLFVHILPNIQLYLPFVRLYKI
jgi:hypothetical protein